MMITDAMNGGDAEMEETKDSLYAAFKAKDTRFDGRFFVGISSTGIYCRPVCRAKQAKKENCTFFSSAAEAEAAAGFRPCLLCRPELAPGSSEADAASVFAHRGGRAAGGKLWQRTESFGTCGEAWLHGQTSAPRLYGGISCLPGAVPAGFCLPRAC